MHLSLIQFIFKLFPLIRHYYRLIQVPLSVLDSFVLHLNNACQSGRRLKLESIQEVLVFEGGKIQLQRLGDRGISWLR